MRILLLLACALAAHAQGRFSATTGDVSLSAAGTKLTIQQPDTGAKQVRLEAVVVFCSVACDVTQSQNGTAASTTAGSASPILPTAKAAAASIFTASNVGAGSAAGGILHLAGGVGTERTLDLSPVFLGNTGSGTNYTIVISTITGTANITLFWSEQ